MDEPDQLQVLLRLEVRLRRVEQKVDLILRAIADRLPPALLGGPMGADPDDVPPPP